MTERHSPSSGSPLSRLGSDDLVSCHPDHTPSVQGVAYSNCWNPRIEGGNARRRVPGRASHLIYGLVVLATLTVLADVARSAVGGQVGLSKSSPHWRARVHPSLDLAAREPRDRSARPRPWLRRQCAQNGRHRVRAPPGRGWAHHPWRSPIFLELRSDRRPPGRPAARRVCPPTALNRRILRTGRFGERNGSRKGTSLMGSKPLLVKSRTSPFLGDKSAEDVGGGIRTLRGVQIHQFGLAGRPRSYQSRRRSSPRVFFVTPALLSIMTTHNMSPTIV